MEPQQQQQQLMAPLPQQQQLMASPQKQQQQQQQQRGDMMQNMASTPQPSVGRIKRPLRRERHMTDSDDNVKQILATHAYEGRQVDVKPLLQLSEEVLLRSPATALDGTLHHQQASMASPMDSLDEEIHQESFDGMLEALSYTVHKISCELTYKCSGGGDADKTTVTLFNMLSSFAWDAKAVLVLAAFAVIYGEFSLVAELNSTNPLAKSVSLLKQLPDINLLRPKFEALNALVKAMVDVTKCVVKFNELPPEYIAPDEPPMSVAIDQIPTAVYWTIRSAVACTSQITDLIGLAHECIPSATETYELSSLTRKVKKIHDHLLKQLELCYKHVDEKKNAETSQTLVRLFETVHIDNMKILKALICAKDDMQPLLEGSTKKQVGLEVLRRKHVLLLISEREIPEDELSILEQMYIESRDQPTRPESQYEVVWLPLVDRALPWTEAKQREFDRFQATMPWYSVHHPSLIDPAVIKYIKDVWHFNKKPILVVLDPQGRVVSPNALHMMWIWGSLAFPFTSMREEALWKEETWRLELLVDGIDPNILNWIVEERFICLYGGEDTEWIRKFTIVARQVAQAARIPFEMVYVGKSNPRDRVRRNIEVITAEKLSYCWPDLTAIWFFWIRLESMWYSKMQHGKTIENDRIMQEIVTMLSFDGSEQGWALISKGSGGSGMARAGGETILDCFLQFDRWKEHAHEKGFSPALNDHLQELHTPHHCSRLILPGANAVS